MIPYSAVTATKDGLMMCVACDTYLGRSLLAYGEFSPDEQAMWEDYVPHGGVAVDAGANIGVHTIALARMVGPEGVVYAFEPQRVLLQMCAGNAQLANCPNVVTVHSALGAESGAIRIPNINYGAPQNFGGCDLGVYAAATQDGTGELVPIRTLDSLGFERLDFLKIDVEGMEKDVLVGARATITKCRPVLYVENDRPHKALALLGEIKALGYTPYSHTIPLFNPDNFKGNPVNIFGDTISLNLLCVLPEHPQPVGLKAVG